MLCHSRNRHKICDMSKFEVQDAFSGNTVGFGPNYRGLEIVINTNKLPVMHGTSYVLSAVLASNREIDEAVNNLIADLEVIRVTAKQRLKGGN
jgi:hypothetical protein